MFTSLRRQRGSAIMGLMLIAFVGSLALIFTRMSDLQTKTTSRKVKSTRFSVMLESGVETMVLAYRLAEISYNVALGKCTAGTARPFLDGLKNGHGCVAGVDTIRIFGDSDAAGLQIAPLYSYANPAGCTITMNDGLKCGGKAPPVSLVTLGATNETIAQRVDGYSLQFSMTAILPSRKLTEYSVRVTDPRDNKSVQRAFAIRASLTNAAHLESDGRVTQEAPDPLSRCPGTAWGTLSIYNPGTRSCRDFGKLGSGIGLAYHDLRFFGFRPADGQVVDLLAAGGASADADYMIDPATGATVAGGPSIFPPYSKAALINTDDITIIGSQIYFIARSAAQAHIGALSMDGSALADPPQNPPDVAGQPARVPLCPLGALGWGQSYIGIASLDWSDPIFYDVGETERIRMATFLAKTDPGYMLTVTVRSAKGAPPPGESGCVQFKLRGVNHWSCCNVFKDENVQQVEYRRTLGFDRTDTQKPFFLY